MNILTTGTVIKELGITRRQLLYSEEMGYLPIPERSTDNKRIYTPKDIEIMRGKLISVGVIESIG